MSGRGPNPLGAKGEQWAAEYLVKRGFVIHHRNWRCRYGEIDLIAGDDIYLLFVEVKARQSEAFASPQAFVTPAKQRRILRTASQYLMEHPEECRQPRFDVCAIVANQGGEPPNIYYLENAFDGGDTYDSAF